MIVLDTNVLSELMKARPVAKVVEWLAAQLVSSVHTTSITQAEILHGLLLLPQGRKRNNLEAAAQAMFEKDFGGRILPFGSDAAPLYARIAADRQKTGRPISQFDAQIAAIVRLSGAALATRNVTDFQECGVTVINPWDS